MLKNNSTTVAGDQKRQLRLKRCNQEGIFCLSRHVGAIIISVRMLESIHMLLETNKGTLIMYQKL